MFAGIKKIERAVWVILILVIIAGSYLYINKLQSSLNETNQARTDLVEENKAVQQREVQLTNENTANKAKLAQQTDEISKLKSAGPTITTSPTITPNPQGKVEKVGTETVVTDLLKHPELIPYKGVLGGTMIFFKEGIQVLSDKWVYASFEDGHIGGYMLLGYSSKNGIITWKVIDSYLYQMIMKIDDSAFEAGEKLLEEMK